MTERLIDTNILSINGLYCNINQDWPQTSQVLETCEV
jgi:hypothetical protein